MGSDSRNLFSGKLNLTTQSSMAHFRRIAFLFIVSTCFAVFMQTVVHAPASAAPSTSDDWKDWDEEEEETCFSGMCLHYSFLEIRDVAFEPPEADKPCRVSVKFSIAGVPERDSRDIAYSQLESATIHYVVDNDFQNRSRSEMECVDLVCRADIPGYPEGSQVTFVISASNAFGHMTTELFRAGTPQNLHNALISMPHKNDDGEFPPDNLDVLQSVAAFDNDRLYMGYSVQGVLSPGQIEPLAMNLYGIAFKPIDDQIDQTLFMAFSGFFWLYFPAMAEWKSQGFKLFDADGWQGETNEEIETFKRTGHIVVDLDKMMQKQAQQIVMTQADQRVEMCDGGTFIGSVNRDNFGMETGNLLRIAILTTSNNSEGHILAWPFDSPTNMFAYLRNHEYSVGAAPGK